MNNLQKIQQDFQAQLLAPDSQNKLYNHIVKTKSPSGKQRIRIYTDGYRARLIEALSANYSQLSAYMGQISFDKMAKAYIKKHPSNFRAIQAFGDKLSIFLQQYYPLKPILAELAKFEWAIGNTFDAVDQKTANVTDLQKIEPLQWANMKFIFHPSVSYHNFNCNVVTIWDGLLNKQRKRQIKLKKPQTIIFWRHNLETFYSVLPDAEAAAINFANQSFAKICDVLCQYYDEQSVANKSLSLLIKWLNSGLISQIA
jgi:hypothetical protein